MMWIYRSNISDISQEVKAWSQMVFQMDNDPKHTSKVKAKWLKDNSRGIGVAITKP
jgi:hypothetical protein